MLMSRMVFPVFVTFVLLINEVSPTFIVPKFISAGTFSAVRSFTVKLAYVAFVKFAELPVTPASHAVRLQLHVWLFA